VNITRRQFAIATGTLALTGAVGGLVPHWLAPAQAQNATPADLLKPGPLGDMVLGDDKAPVTIIEYASMTCPHCAAFHAQTFPELKKRLIDTGKVRFIMREFPLDPLAQAAFMLARCSTQEMKPSEPGSAAAKVAAQRYHAMVETLFAKQREWAVRAPLPPLLAIAKQAGFTEESFNACLRNQTLLEAVKESGERGSKFGVNSTPTFFINGKKFSGTISIDEIEKEVAPFLKS
jgi:protein-disulfide isomerase